MIETSGKAQHTMARRTGRSGDLVHGISQGRPVFLEIDPEGRRLYFARPSLLSLLEDEGITGEILYVDAGYHVMGMDLSDD